MRHEKIEAIVLATSLGLVWIGGMMTGFFLSLLLRPFKNPWRSVP